MGRLTALAICCVLAAPHVGRGFYRADQASQFTDAQIAAATIIVSRESNGGFGYMDPTDLRNGSNYTVGVNGDGTVFYMGTHGVGMMGSLTHKIPADSVRVLVEEFLRAGFFGFEDGYRVVDHGGLSVVSNAHADGTTLTLLIGAQFKTVYAKQGIPIKLLELARRVEEVTDVRRYTGKPLWSPGEHTQSGRITNSSGEPLAGATVKMVGDVVYESTSDSDGRYEIPGVFTDDYVFIADAAGFVNTVAKRTVGSDRPPDWNALLEQHEGPLALLKLRNKLNLSAGGTTHDCGEFLLPADGMTADAAAVERALQCAELAKKNRLPFRIVVEQPGYKTWSAFGVAGGPDSLQVIYEFFDSPCTGPKCRQLAAQMCYFAKVTTDGNGRFTCAAP